MNGLLDAEGQLGTRRLHCPSWILGLCPGLSRHRCRSERARIYTGLNKRTCSAFNLCSSLLVRQWPPGVILKRNSDLGGNPSCTKYNLQSTGFLLSETILNYVIIRLYCFMRFWMKPAKQSIFHGVKRKTTRTTTKTGLVGLKVEQNTRSCKYKNYTQCFFSIKLPGILLFKESVPCIISTIWVI